MSYLAFKKAFKFEHGHTDCCIQPEPVDGSGTPMTRRQGGSGMYGQPYGGYNGGRQSYGGGGGNRNMAGLGGQPS